MNRPAAPHPFSVPSVTPHPFSMTWRAGLFAHWPFDPDVVRPLVPDPLELDTYDGRAWISVLPFVLARAGVRGSPEFARLGFPEVNVRTYVQLDGTSGLYFFAADVDQSLVARLVRATTRLPCHDLDASVRIRGAEVEFEAARSARSPAADGPRGRFAATYQPDGEVFHADRGTLDHLLAERRRMYDPRGRGVFYAEIAHEPWPLQRAEATIHRNTLFEATCLPRPETAPRLRYAGRLSMTGSVPRIVRAGRRPALD